MLQIYIIKQYAGDSQLYLFFSSQNLNIQLLFNQINQVAYDHNLKLNALKASFLLFGKNKKQIAFILFELIFNFIFN